MKPWHDTGQAQLTKQVEAAEAVAKQANEELLAAYRRAEAAETEAKSHHVTRLELKVMHPKHQAVWNAASSVACRLMHQSSI